ncbi:MAG TPA: T9SS type A sorting domain-containing protein [Chitinophagales bacterium]|nr:T9SS type A sorting domain-containing protein [Chitinophagales bacterium]
MKKTTISVICLCLSLLTAGISNAQTLERQVVASAGDYYAAPTFSLSWTLGEPVVETVDNAYMMLTQGFQQGELKVTAVKEPLAELFDISVFPNPTSDVLNIAINSDKAEIISVQLYSMTGERLISEKTQQKNFQLNLADLASASYLLSLRKLDGRLITTYVINKSR